MEEYIENVEGPVFPGLNAPSCIMIGGVSGSGKTTLVHKILQHKEVMFKKPVKRILYCMSVDQPLYGKMMEDVPRLTFHKGIPTQDVIDAFTNGTHHCLIVLDDLMEQVVRSVQVQALFTKYSHHKQISVIFVSQNIYAAGKCSRTISLNQQYFFVLCNPRDVRQINILAQQTGLGQTLKESYQDCMLKKLYGYQLICLHSTSIDHNPDDSPRIRARIYYLMKPTLG